MKKPDLSTKTIIRYIRDFSIVVAGIAVTLYVNYKLTNQGEKRDMNLYLNAIQIELEENLKELNKAVAYYQNDMKYAAYLQSHDKKSLNRDTVRSYGNTFFSVQIFSFKTNAFEMFKYSGTMRLIADKELLLSIWEVYDDFNSVKYALEWISRAKWDDYRKELSLIVENDMKMTDIPMYNYYISGMPQSGLQACEELLNESKELIAKLESKVK
jgi:hypothetical protein